MALVRWTSASAVGVITAAAPMSGCTSSARSSRMRCARARTRRHTRDARTSQQERDERADGGREREREPRVFISRIGGGSSGSSFACAQSAMAVHHVAASFSPCPHPFPSLSPLSLSLSLSSLCAPPSVCARVTDLSMLFALSSPYPSHPPSSSWSPSSGPYRRPSPRCSAPRPTSASSSTTLTRCSCVRRGLDPLSSLSPTPTPRPPITACGWSRVALPPRPCPCPCTSSSLRPTQTLADRPRHRPSPTPPYPPLPSRILTPPLPQVTLD